MGGGWLAKIDKIVLFGETLILVDGHDVSKQLRSREALDVLVYLILNHKSGADRRALGAEVFYHLSAESALEALGQALHRLRRITEDSRFPPGEKGSNAVFVVDNLSVDLVEFDDYIEQARPLPDGEEAAALLLEATNRYDEPVAIGVGNWFAPKRERLQQDYIWAKRRLAEIARKTRRLEVAAQHCLDLIHQFPTETRFYVDLMGVYATRGSRADLDEVRTSYYLSNPSDEEDNDAIEQAYSAATHRAGIVIFNDRPPTNELTKHDVLTDAHGPNGAVAVPSPIVLSIPADEHPENAGKDLKRSGLLDALYRQLAPDQSSPALYREIEYIHQLETVASDTTEVARFKIECLRRLCLLAITRLNATINSEESFQEIKAITRPIDKLQREVLAAVSSVDHEDQIGGEAVHLVRKWSRIAAEFLLVDKTQYEAIAASSRAGAPTSVRLKLDHAASKLSSGMMSLDDKERDDAYEDAYTTYCIVAETAFGRTDRTTWFQLGWLMWKHYRDLDKAIQYFSDAAECSNGQRDIFCRKILRHLAYMQYLQGDLKAAYDTSRFMMDIGVKPQALFDIARYQACSGKTTASYVLELIDVVLVVFPAQYIALLIDDDFSGVQQECRKCLGELTLDAQDYAATGIQRWEENVKQLLTAHACQQTTTSLPEAVTNGYQVAKQLCEQADYFTFRLIGRNAHEVNALVMQELRQICEREHAEYKQEEMLLLKKRKDIVHSYEQQRIAVKGRYVDAGEQIGLSPLTKYRLRLQLDSINKRENADLSVVESDLARLRAEMATNMTSIETWSRNIQNVEKYHLQNFE